MTKAKFRWERLEGVLAEIIETPSKKRIKVLEGQGELEPKMVSGDRTKREPFSHGNIVKINIRATEKVSYYSLEGEMELFAENIHDSKVKEYIESAFEGGVFSGSSGSEPEVEEKWEVDADEAKKHIVKVPAIPKDSDLIMGKRLWGLIIGSITMDKYPLILGPKGCGKSISAQAAAKALGMEYVAFNLGQAFKPKKMFVGGLAAGDKGTFFVSSEFLTAFSSEKPTLIFLDEITRVPVQAANYLMTILDRRQSYIYNEDEGTRVERGAGVRFISAGNIGMQYTDTRTLDGAFFDRFMKIQLGYLTPKKEVEFLCAKYPYANPKDVSKLVEQAVIVRKAEENASISTSISTRQLEDLTAYLQGGFKISDIETMFLNNFVNGNIDERQQVRGYIQSA